MWVHGNEGTAFSDLEVKYEKKEMDLNNLCSLGCAAMAKRDTGVMATTRPSVITGHEGWTLICPSFTHGLKQLLTLPQGHTSNDQNELGDGFAFVFQNTFSFFWLFVLFCVTVPLKLIKNLHFCCHMFRDSTLSFWVPNWQKSNWTWCEITKTHSCLPTPPVR